jgi:hypothetical protein
LPARFKFELAGAAEDEALRAVLRATAMRGRVALSFRREPDFFAAERAGNLSSQVLAARDTASGEVVGLGCRGLRRLYVNGEAQTVGYLSGLRGLPAFRGGTLLARAYRFLKELHGDGQAPFYVTTIFDDNHEVRALLTSGRAGLPVYHPLGHFYTYLLPLYGRRKTRPVEGAVVRGAGWGLDSAAVECVNDFNRRHQFGAVYAAEDLHGRGLLPAFRAENLYLYLKGPQVRATLGVWDQNSFKQPVVAGYSWPYRLVRPLSGAGARLGLCAKLPRVGEAFRYLYAALLSCPSDEPRLLDSLLDAALDDWSGRGYAYLLVGVHEESPFAGPLRRRSAMRLSSSVYLVYWRDGCDRALPSGARVPHLELATL